MSIAVGAAALSVPAIGSAAVVVTQAGQSCAVQQLGETTCQWIDGSGAVTGLARVQVSTSSTSRPEHFGVSILPGQGLSWLPGQGAVDVSGIGYTIQSHYAYPFVRDMKSSLYVGTSRDVRTYGEIIAQLGMASNPVLAASFSEQFWHLGGDQYYHIRSGYQLQQSSDTWSAHLSWDVARDGAVSSVFLNTLAGIPEPEQWLLMVLGFGAIGARLRSAGGRRRVLATA